MRKFNICIDQTNVLMRICIINVSDLCLFNVLQYDTYSLSRNKKIHKKLVSYKFYGNLLCYRDFYEMK